MGTLGFLHPDKKAFYALDKLLLSEDMEFILYTPDMQYKKIIEEWLIRNHHPMLMHLVSGFVEVSNMVPREPVMLLGFPVGDLWT